MTRSEVLLGQLIEERLTPGADLREIDERIRAHFEEECCVAFIDAAGFGRRPTEGTISLLCLIHEFRRIARPLVESHQGEIVKSVGDGLLLLFRRAPDALQCLLQLNRTLASYNAGRPPDQRLEVTSGIGFGRVLRVGSDGVFGAEVHHASRLGQDLAEPYEVLVTDAARAALLHTPNVEFAPASVTSSIPVYRAIYDLPGH